MNVKYKYYFFEEIDGVRLYLMDDMESMTENKAEAALFSLEDWEDWGEWNDDLQKEELSEAEKLRALGSPMLPGFEEETNE